MRMRRRDAGRPGVLALVLFGMAVGAARAEVALQVTSVQGGASLEVDFGTARGMGREERSESYPSGLMISVIFDAELKSR